MIASYFHGLSAILIQQTHFPVSIPANWKSADDLPVADPYLKNWLLDTGSLTERLQSHCADFRVELVGQRQMSPDDEELTQLTLNSPHADDMQWQVREVILYGNGQPWVFARSVLPQQLCEMDLAELGNKPLGKIIFNDNRFVRSPFQLLKLTNTLHFANFINTTDQQPLWGRRSVFDFQQLQLMVAEIFLPECPAYSKQNLI
ncbi:chorismate lyase [Aliiglaciecola sp. SL4]|uniref:chorismate--pyruvate lyase family protein n=1 Tax=Aliiglaciecola sp. SL4 TaxID=3239806 RepID=UPI00355C93FB